jgi:hypothetical protein
MSIGSRPGGSRASDEESKTAVKVGTSRAYLQLLSLMISFLLTAIFSRACTPTAETNRPRLRIDSATIPALHGACDVANQSGH